MSCQVLTGTQQNKPLGSRGEQEEAVSEDSPVAMESKQLLHHSCRLPNLSMSERLPLPQLQPILKQTPIVPYEFHFLVFKFKLAYRITCFPMTVSYILNLFDVNLD